jgi:hypothetical protein
MLPECQVIGRGGVAKHFSIRQQRQATERPDPSRLVLNKIRTTFARSLEMIRMVRTAFCALAVLAASAPAWAARNVGCGADVGLTMSIAGTTSAATPSANDPAPVPPAYKLVSDGGGAYANGVKVKGGTLEVIFQISNCTFDFTARLFNLPRKLFVTSPGGDWLEVPFFNFDRVGSVPITSADLNSQLTDPKAQVFCADGAIIYSPSDATKPLIDANGVVHDNYGGCHMDADGRWYVLRAAGMTVNLTASGSSQAHYRFNVSPLDTPDAGACPGADPRCATSLVRVYHPDASTWVIVPHDIPSQLPPQPSSTNWLAAYVTSFSPLTITSYPSVPFKITLTK